MSEAFTNFALIFLGGFVFGVYVTYRWNKPGRSKGTIYKNQTELEYVSAPPSNLGSNKLLMVVRNDLKMGKGKVAAQCSHAAVMAYASSQVNRPEIFAEWKKTGQAKVVVKIDNEKEMMDLAVKAKNNQLLVSIVQDAGRTQVASGTKTVLAIGPGPKHIIDQVAGHLKLY